MAEIRSRSSQDMEPIYRRTNGYNIWRGSPIGLRRNACHRTDARRPNINAAMIVLCRTPDCGAILRTSQSHSALQTVLARDAKGLYFVCPRCRARNEVVDRRRQRVAVPVEQRVAA